MNEEEAEKGIHGEGEMGNKDGKLRGDSRFLFTLSPFPRVLVSSPPAGFDRILKGWQDRHKTKVSRFAMS